VAARVGYDFPLGELFSFWPKAGLGLATHSQSDGPTANRLFVHAFAPFLVHPAPHFFLGLGPRAERDLSSKWDGRDANRGTDIGITSVVGGWF
jgi:hypothetical protein